MTLIINDTQHNVFSVIMIGVVMLSVVAPFELHLAIVASFNETHLASKASQENDQIIARIGSTNSQFDQLRLHQIVICPATVVQLVEQSTDDPKFKGLNRAAASTE